MRRPGRTALATAAAVALAGIAVSAQSTSQRSGQSQPTTGRQTATSQQSQRVTVVGCVQREEDYRRVRGEGRGGVVGTGLGAGNEFVLVNAQMSTGGSQSRAERPTTGQESQTATSGMAYELTGKNEGKVAEYVGRRVEITGMLSPAEPGAVGGPTADVPLSQDLKIRELEVTSVRPVAGTCPTQ